MIDEYQLLRLIQGAPTDRERLSLLIEFRKESKNIGFERGEIRCMGMITESKRRIMDCIKKENNRLIDELREEINNIKEENVKKNIQSNL